MSKSDEAIREFAENWGDYMEVDEQGRWSLYNHRNEMYNALTALIGEHYVAKAAYIALENTLAKAEAKNLELLQQRDELKEALILAEGLIDMASDKEWAKIRAAIKNTKDETDTIQR